MNYVVKLNLVNVEQMEELRRQLQREKEAILKTT